MGAGMLKPMKPSVVCTLTVEERLTGGAAVATVGTAKVVVTLT